jgi:hypothetical protein
MRRFRFILPALLLIPLAACDDKPAEPTPGNPSKIAEAEQAATDTDCKLLTAAEAKAALATGNDMNKPWVNTDTACIMRDATDENYVEALVKPQENAAAAQAALQDRIEHYRGLGDDNLNGPLGKPLPGTQGNFAHCNPSNASIDFVKGAKWVHVDFAFNLGKTGSMTCDNETLGRLRTLAEQVASRV